MGREDAVRQPGEAGQLHPPRPDRRLPPQSRRAGDRAIRRASDAGQPEVRTYKVKVALIEAKIESDHDIHLIVAAPDHKLRQMIAEFPDTHCKGAAASSKRAKMAAARAAFLKDCGTIAKDSFTKLKGTATLIGVGFYDMVHGQIGHSPNGIELHPVLGYSGSCSKPSSGGGGGGGNNCTPGYSPCLVYHGGADYDCAGGGGNGPYYTEPGVTYKVTGSDPYQLDGDNDGLGCE